MPGPTDAQVWRRAFCRLYGVPAPVVPLATIIHWAAGVRAWGGGERLATRSAYVPAGYFYEPHTPAPDRAAIAAALAQARRQDALLVLYPVVRQDDAAPLANAGFVAVPWFVEAEYRVADGLDADLRRQLGARRFAGLRRIDRRAERDFAWEALGLRDAAAAFDRLHRLNLAKYGHARNHFGREIVALLERSPLEPRLLIFCLRPRTGEEPVLAALALRDPDAATLRVLVQGIDHARVPTAQNLYMASFVRIYRWGLERGIRRFNLGRGSELVKLNLGANRFHVLANHLAGIEAGELAALRTRAGASLAETLGELRAAVARRAASERVQIPEAVR